ncbi:iron-containing alcohol dehydrogenase family protein [Paraburkholderia sp. HD33-4]|uniref:iron-containing alcohol dehydrogenase family protein n=1 Tax=Paraburkholderia sp. HD33-4 TaxID=2883242 RepID=UPI001F19BD4E|nr:iron-containing alcohol dehydrogenase family protein [Paraburkholderia sp. HD33-4]
MNCNVAALSFQHVSSELRLFCGEDSLGLLSRELGRFDCRRVAVVCGQSVGASHLIETLRATLGPLFADVCKTVQPNSPIAAVAATANALKNLDADGVIAVGGGSAAVTARAASILMAEQTPVKDLCTTRDTNGHLRSPKLDKPKLPQFAIPTTPSTAFVKGGSAVLDPSGHRLALFDPKTRAKAVILSPAFLQTSPPALVRAAALNTLCTAVEALSSPTCDAVSEAMLRQAVRLTAQHLPNVESDTSARLQAAIAAVLCGRGTDNGGGGLASALGHAIGHRYSVDNGTVNTIVLPYTMRFNAAHVESTTARIIEALDLYGGALTCSPPSEEQAIASLNAILDTLPVPRRLRDIGVARTDLPSISCEVMSDWFVNRNPRPVTSAEEVTAVLEAAW